MKLFNARLKGFIGIKKGLGLEEINLDLSGLSGLVALQGDNGQGKTTLLENLQPFRTLPSRKGTLKNHCYLKDSEKELSFEFHGDTYRTLVKMNALTTTRDEGFIWKNGDSMVDGLVTNYDQYLLDLLGSQSLFFASIFCAQNSEKLSDLRPAQLKSLFAEFLRLDRYVAWEDTGKAAAGIYRMKIGELQDRINRTNTDIKMLGDPRADLKSAEKFAARLDIDAVDIDMQMDAKAERIEELKKICLESRIALEKLTVLQGTRDKISKILSELKEGFDKRESELLGKTDDLLTEVMEAEQTIQNKDEIQKAAIIVMEANKAITRIDEEAYILNLDIKDSNELITNERERAALSTEKINALKLDKRIYGLERVLDGVNSEISQISHKVENIRDDPELVKIQATIEAMEKSAAVLDDIDPGCTSEICGLITRSLDDKKNLPAIVASYKEAKSVLLDKFDAQRLKLTERVSELTNQSEAIDKEISLRTSALQARLDEINKSGALIQMHNTQLGEKLEAGTQSRRAIHDAKVNAKDLADQAPLIVIAEARLNDLNRMVNDIKVGSAANELKFLADTKALNETLESTDAEIKEVRQLINDDADMLFEKAEYELRILAGQKETITGDAIKNILILAAAKKEVENLLIMESELRVIDQRKGNHLLSLNRWVYIQDACSKDGLRALEIEGVAPVITGYANEMLTGTFGPNHTVRFETLDEDGREVLNIVVISGDGSETLLSNLSGGESVWILKSLRLAQTLISQQKSGRHFETSLMDEEDGALSNDNAIKFIALYGTLMKMARMSSCYFISHRPDAINMADHLINFGKGGISIS